MILDLTTTKELRQLAEKLSDPVCFIESLLTFNGKPLRLYDYQKRIARDSNWMEQQVKLCLVQARQTGKSLLVAALLVFYAARYPYAKILVLSRTKEQSSLVARYAREFLLSSPLLSNLIDKSLTRKSDLVLTNGSILFDRTMGIDSMNIRGLTLSNHGVLVVDEAAYGSDAGIKNILPAAYGCSHVLVSTPHRKRGYFYDAVQSGKYTTYHVPASRCPRISREEIETMRRLYRPSEFKNEVAAEFSQGADCVFDPDSIEKAINHDTPLFDADSFDFDTHFPFKPDLDKNYVFSLDVSKIGRDCWVLTIGDLDRRNNTMEVVAYHIWAGNMHEGENLNATLTDDPRLITRMIMQYAERFRCRKMYVDSTSNEFYADTLLHAHLLPVEKFCFSAQSKERIVEHLATTLRAEKLGIPNDLDMIGELLDFSYDVKKQETNLERRIYLSGADDRVDSLAMLAQAITGETLSAGGYIDAW